MQNLLNTNNLPPNFSGNQKVSAALMGTVSYSNLQNYAPNYDNLSPPVSYPNRRQYEEVYAQQRSQSNNYDRQNNYQYRQLEQPSYRLMFNVKIKKKKSTKI